MNGSLVDMETTLKYDYMIERLNAGELVKCKSCGKGIYRPFNPDAKINHSYVCDNCGANVHWDPVVEVK